MRSLKGIKGIKGIGTGLALLSLSFLAACGGGSGKSDDKNTPTPSVGIMSPTAPVEAGATVALTVTLTGTDYTAPATLDEGVGSCQKSMTAVNCTMPETLNADGTYHVTVTATTATANPKTATATIKAYYAAPTIAITSPLEVRVEQGKTAAFTAAKTLPVGQPQEADNPTKWDGSDCAAKGVGTIDADGLFTAASKSGSCSATASIVDRDGGKISANDAIHVTVWANPVPVAVSPATATVYWGDTRNFTAASFANPAGENFSLQWGFAGECDKGTIAEASGRFTAGRGSSGSCTVQAYVTGYSISIINILNIHRGQTNLKYQTTQKN